jgi:SAM-dependent methyltransferase
MSDSNFDFCGLASVSDINTFGEVFNKLEMAQSDFLSKNDLFRSSEYKWPIDALHTWSRNVEYPYVYYHLQKFIDKFNGTPSVLDFGCGVTFFPFEIAKLGAKVTGVDISPEVKRDIDQAKKVFGLTDKNINCLLNPDSRLALPSESQDIIYSISVIEHMERVDIIAAEFARLLKPEGRLILTFDLDLRGDKQIQPKEYEVLKKTLLVHFESCFDNRLIHPKTMLTTINSNYPLTGSWIYRLKNGIKNFFRNIFEREIILYPSYFLGCELLVLKKRG